MAVATTKGFDVAALDDIEAGPEHDGRVPFNIRRHFDIRAFGIRVNRAVGEGRDPAVITDSLKCGAAAGHLGMSLDALAQQLAELEARGLIETCDKGLRLLDVDALERLVDGRE